MTLRRRFVPVLAMLLLAPASHAGVGDPQIKTDHPFYPGELSCSTFDRLFATQAALYQRITGRDVTTDEDKALASWYWRNINYAHGEPGPCDYFAQPLSAAGPTREYWTGLFAHGFGLCGTTHAQWTAEMNALLGHCRSRVTGTTGHNSFEVFLAGGAYGDGKWALLDHDLSTVIFDGTSSRLLSLQEVAADLKKVADPRWKPLRQRGWRISGLHDSDKDVYTSFGSVEYLAGYAGPPPMLHLRKGESVRRYLEPGLDDGKTFVFWGRNYNTAGIPGPERSLTWVNQPEKMHGAKSAVPHKPGQARYGNAAYTYTPNFADGSYKEAAFSEADQRVTFSFRTPYVIAATPPNDKPWGIHDDGCTNGLLITGALDMPVAISTDNQRTWHELPAEPGRTRIDLTDRVKGRQHYLLRFGAPASVLKDKKISWRTICQLNPTLIPHLKDGPNRITYHSSGQAVVSAGPEKTLSDGHKGRPAATLELFTPSAQRGTHVYASSWVASGNPPSDTGYNIRLWETNGPGRDMLFHWRIIRRPPEPKDFWSQSFNWADADLGGQTRVNVTFENTTNRAYRQVEAHLVYQVSDPSPCTVTFAWTEPDGQTKTASHTYPIDINKEDTSWTLTPAPNSETRWVEYRTD